MRWDVEFGPPRHNLLRALCPRVVGRHGIVVDPCLFRLLGDEIGTIHSRTELGELLKIHVQHGALDVETGREVAGAMTYKERTVRDVMTPAKDCFMLSVSEKLNFKVINGGMHVVVLCRGITYSSTLRADDCLKTGVF